MYGRNEQTRTNPTPKVFVAAYSLVSILDYLPESVLRRGLHNTVLPQSLVRRFPCVLLGNDTRSMVV